MVKKIYRYVNAFSNSDTEFSDRKIMEPKEVKKVNKIPYFELVVKKIKVEKKADNECKEYRKLWCGECPRRPKMKIKEGNWVNGENLEKRIKRLEEKDSYYPMEEEIRDIKVGGTD